MAKRLLSGSEAVAYAAMAEGASVIAGYPTDSTAPLIEAALRQMRNRTATGLTAQWAMNDKTALGICAGASIAGLRAVAAFGHAGFSEVVQGAASLNFAGVRGGLAIVVVDEPASDIFTTNLDVRRVCELAKIPILDPATPGLAFDSLKAAFMLSERFKVPVVIHISQDLAQTSTFFDITPHTRALGPKGGLLEGKETLVIDDLLTEDPKRSFDSVQNAPADLDSRLRDIAHRFTYKDRFGQFNHVQEFPCHLAGKHNSYLTRKVISDEAINESTIKIGVCACGAAAPFVLEAVERLRAEAERSKVSVPMIRVMSLGTPYPVPKRSIRKFLNGLNHVLVIEEFSAFAEEELLRLSATNFLGPNIHGRYTDEVNYNYPVNFDTAILHVAAFIDRCLSMKANASGADLGKAAGLDGSRMNTFGEGAAGSGEGVAFSEAARYAEGSAYSEGRSFAEDATGILPGRDALQGAYADSYADKTRILKPLSNVGKHTAAEEGKALSPKQSRTLTGIARRLASPESMYEFLGKVPPRQPVLCSGCPHRASLFAIKEALERLKISCKDAAFSADVGCSLLGNNSPLHFLDYYLGEGFSTSLAQGLAIAAQGQSELEGDGRDSGIADGLGNAGRAGDIAGNGAGTIPDGAGRAGDNAEPREIKSIAALGDSSFFSSAIPSIANAITNDTDITVIVLNNRICAESGLQPTPTTRKRIDIADVLRALGMANVREADPFEFGNAMDACVKALRDRRPSAVVLTSKCARMVRPEKVSFINTNKCTGCRECITQLGCPAIYFDAEKSGPKSEGGQAVIDIDQCIGCKLCMHVCPNEAIRVMAHKDVAELMRKERDLVAKRIEEEEAMTAESANEDAGASPEDVAVMSLFGGSPLVKLDDTDDSGAYSQPEEEIELEPEPPKPRVSKQTTTMDFDLLFGGDNAELTVDVGDDEVDVGAVDEADEGAGALGERADDEADEVADVNGAVEKNTEAEIVESLKSENDDDDILDDSDDSGEIEDVELEDDLDEVEAVASDEEAVEVAEAEDTKHLPKNAEKDSKGGKR